MGARSPPPQPRFLTSVFQLHQKPRPTLVARHIACTPRGFGNLHEPPHFRGAVPLGNWCAFLIFSNGFNKENCCFFRILVAGGFQNPRKRRPLVGNRGHTGGASGTPPENPTMVGFSWGLFHGRILRGSVAPTFGNVRWLCVLHL